LIKHLKDAKSSLLFILLLGGTNYNCAQDILNLYGEIDAFSQGKLQRPLPNGVSARNMGKNDLWIAAAASATQSILLSTDRDFAHLEGAFIKFEYYDPKLYY
jgi:tRNA(fMet)-specific endonuclease VapC